MSARTTRMAAGSPASPRTTPATRCSWASPSRIDRGTSPGRTVPPFAQARSSGRHRMTDPGMGQSSAPGGRTGERPTLVVDDVRVIYPGRAAQVTAVDGVSFELSQRGSLAILGESGSGKTTLGLAIMGLLG